jgi:hypothetical protein
MKEKLGDTDRWSGFNDERSSLERGIDDETTHDAYAKDDKHAGIHTRAFAQKNSVIHFFLRVPIQSRGDDGREDNIIRSIFET